VSEKRKRERVKKRCKNGEKKVCEGGKKKKKECVCGKKVKEWRERRKEKVKKSVSEERVSEKKM
jgi:hypothetical protein